MSKLPDTDDVRVKDLAAYWKCGKSTIYDMVAAGLIAHFRVGKGKKRPAIRIPHSAIKDYETGE